MTLYETVVRWSGVVTEEASKQGQKNCGTSIRSASKLAVSACTLTLTLLACATLLAVANRYREPETQVRVGPSPPGATRELGVTAMLLLQLRYTPSRHNCQPCAARIIHRVE
jgi:hypothetical protein